MNYQSIMVRELKKDNHVLALILSSYDPKTDMLQYIDTTTHLHSVGRYIQLRDRSALMNVKKGSKYEKVITNLLRQDGIEPVFTNKFGNPNRTTQKSKK